MDYTGHRVNLRHLRDTVKHRTLQSCFHPLRNIVTTYYCFQLKQQLCVGSLSGYFSLDVGKGSYEHNLEAANGEGQSFRNLKFFALYQQRRWGSPWR